MKESFIRNISKFLIPKVIRDRVSEYYKETYEQKRLMIENALPKVRLSEKNIKNCQILLNRRTMLQKLPQNGYVAEVGVDEGKFSQQIIELCDPQILHLIDLWGSRYYNEEKYRHVINKFKDFIDEDRVIIHRKSSLEAAKEFPDSYFDWIYLDTDHSYETISAELIAYSEKIKPDGFIAGHDYSKGNYVKSTRFGVIEAVHEFCVKHDWELMFITIDPIENQSFVIRRIQ